MQQLLHDNDLILMEAAIVEPLRRSADISLHPRLVNAPLVYDEAGREALARLYRGYADIALAAGKPFLMCAPTWRANRERVEEAGLQASANAEAVTLLERLRESRAPGDPEIGIGGIIGCRNDCYLAEEGLSADAAESFHQWQVDRLAGAIAWWDGREIAPQHAWLWGGFPDAPARFC